MKLDLSVKEEEFVRQFLATRMIPSPKLLIKDYKAINENGEFPTRLVIPATNFTVTFSKIGNLGIKIFLDKVKVNYSLNSIVQASDLKETLEGLGLRKEEVSNKSDPVSQAPDKRPPGNHRERGISNQVGHPRD